MRRKISSPERPKATSNASEEAMQRGIEERGKRNSDSHGARRDASVDLRNDLTPFRQSFFHRPMDPTSAEKHSRSTTPALEESLHQEDLWNSAEVSLSGNEANGSRHTSLPNARASFDGLVDEEGGAWVCSACTFVNENALHLSCSICGTQRDKARRETSISSTSYTPYFTAQEVPGELHEDFQQEAIRSRSEQIEGEWFAELQQKRMKELIQLQLELFEEYGRDGSEAEPDDVSVGNTDCHPMSTTGSVSCTVAKQNGTVASDNLDFAEQNRILDQRRESLLNREQQLQDFQLRQKALWKLSAERVEAEN
jgi:rubrerythrin